MIVVDKLVVGHAKWLIVALGLLMLVACSRGGGDRSEQGLGCLRGCAAKKDACILGAQVATHVQECDGQDRVCAATCSP